MSLLTSSAAAEVTIIEPRRGWPQLDLSELWDFLEFVYFQPWRDPKALVGAGADVPPGLLAELLRWDRRARTRLAKNLEGREAPKELDESLARELGALGYL